MSEEERGFEVISTRDVSDACASVNLSKATTTDNHTAVSVVVSSSSFSLSSAYSAVRGAVAVVLTGLVVFTSLGLVGLGFLVPSRAEARALVALGTHLVFERGTDGRAFETRQPFSLRAGYRFEIGDAYLEYQSFSTSLGTSMVQVARTHRELIAWGRRVIVPSWKMAPYGALGAGVQYDTIETTLGAETSKADGRFEPLLSAAAGFSAAVHEKVELLLESRLTLSSGYSPNPVPGFGLILGWRF